MIDRVVAVVTKTALLQVVTNEARLATLALSPLNRHLIPVGIGAKFNAISNRQTGRAAVWTKQTHQQSLCDTVIALGTSR